MKTEDGVRVVVFDGKDNFLESDKTAPRTMTDNEPFTFAAFVKPGSSGQGSTLLSLAEKAGFSYSGGGMRVEGLRRQARDEALRHGQPRPKTGPWVHVACVYEGSRKPSHIYVDGKLVDSVYWSAFFVRPDFQMKIGNGFGGGIARMQMWRGVKSAEEI
ncbi:MAG: LamG domain-containing protein, partial [bacterium]|nr:LamG domain-containing protein [bacterium]